MKTILRLEKWLFNPPVDGPSATLLLRLMAGGVFVWEGIMKFVFPTLGAGRFTKLGFPAAHLTASLIEAWEIAGGALLMVGLLTRGVAVLFMIDWRASAVSSADRARKAAMGVWTAPNARA